MNFERSSIKKVCYSLLSHISEEQVCKEQNISITPLNFL